MWSASNYANQPRTCRQNSQGRTLVRIHCNSRYQFLSRNALSLPSRIYKTHSEKYIKLHYRVHAVGLYSDRKGEGEGDKGAFAFSVLYLCMRLSTAPVPARLVSNPIFILARRAIKISIVYFEISSTLRPGIPATPLETRQKTSPDLHATDPVSRRKNQHTRNE